MKALAGILAVLLLAAACSPQGSPDSRPPGDDALPEQSVETEDAQSESPDPTVPVDSLPSLEDLLPEQFDVLTRPWHGDLDGMAERRAIRVLVVSGGPQFFYDRGKPRGITAELLDKFRQSVNEKLHRGLDAVEIIPMPVSRDRLIPALLAGKADLIAADMTITERRSEEVDFSTPMARNIDEVLVFKSGASQGIDSLDDLAGQVVYVRKSSSYFEHLTTINEDFAERGLDIIQIQAANELLRTQDIVEMLNAGLISATVLDSFRAKYWKQVFPDIEVREDIAVSTGTDIAWVFRKNSPQLAETVNEFVRRNRQGTLLGNILLQRYLRDAQWVLNATSDVRLKQLRPLLEVFREGATIAELDPLMLVAQAYQESGLDHSKVSPVGAVGIMQIKPSTAADKNVGFDDISSLASNVNAGATYLRFLMNRYFADEEMDDLHQWLFGLAAYNAGPARIQRIRRQAASEGLDPNLWIDNVELVAARQIGRETVNYVRNIFKYYVAYRMAWEERRLRQSGDEA
jgi:membrane-bound lytic murein transglycosylase MltF